MLPTIRMALLCVLYSGAVRRDTRTSKDRSPLGRHPAIRPILTLSPFSIAWQDQPARFTIRPAFLELQKHALVTDMSRLILSHLWH